MQFQTSMASSCTPFQVFFEANFGQQKYLIQLDFRWGSGDTYRGFTKNWRTDRFLASNVALMNRRELIFDSYRGITYINYHVGVDISARTAAGE